MMSWIMISAFAISSSIDNLGVGISYGIRKIQITLSINLLMSVICFVMSIIGINFGLWIAARIPGIFPLIMGAVFLFIIGVRIILLAKPQNDKQDVSNKQEKSLFNSRIGWREAILLGIGLSANALTNGVGAGLLGYSAFYISLAAAIGSLISVWGGVKLGHKLSAVRIGAFTIGEFGSVFSGIIIIIIAIAAFL